MRNCVRTCADTPDEAAAFMAYIIDNLQDSHRFHHRDHRLIEQGRGTVARLRAALIPDTAQRTPVALDRAQRYVHVNAQWMRYAAKVVIGLSERAKV
jgi:hypothetical protein